MSPPRMLRTRPGQRPRPRFDHELLSCFLPNRKTGRGPALCDLLFAWLPTVTENVDASAASDALKTACCPLLCHHETLLLTNRCAIGRGNH